MPRCLVETTAEKAMQPFMMGHVGLWFPFKKINDPADELCFANGQYLLVERGWYDRIGGHDAVRGEFLEDFALAEKLKSNGAPIQVAMGMDRFGTRMYSSFSRIRRGWRRIFLHAFARHPGTLAVRAVDVVTFCALPFLMAPWTLAAAAQGRVPLALGAVAGATLLIAQAAAWKTYGLLKARKRWALLQPLAAFFLAEILLESFWMALRAKKTKWR
jgi:hypothetical protein